MEYLGQSQKKILGFFDWRWFSKDHIHLNNSGHEAIYDAILPILKQIATGVTEQDDNVLEFQKKLEKLGFNLGTESNSGVAGEKTKKAAEKLFSFKASFNFFLRFLYLMIILLFMIKLFYLQFS